MIFFKKYFPHNKTNGLKRQISTFSQKEGETLTQAWDRFRDLLNFCPHHGYETWRIVSYFYEGLTVQERLFIEKMCNGEFLQKDPDEAMEYLIDLAEKSHTWSEPSATDGTSRSRPIGIYHLREEDNLKAQVENLTKQLEALKSQGGRGIHTVARVESSNPCFVCGGEDHQAQDCATYNEMRGVYEEQCNALGNFKKPYSPFSETYNPSWRNHPNFSWRDSNQQAQSSGNQWKSDYQANPPRAYPAQQYNAQPKRSPLEDTLKAFMDAQQATNQKFESVLTQLVEENKEIKSQITKVTSSLAIQERGKFPSQPQSNPKGL